MRAPVGDLQPSAPSAEPRCMLVSEAFGCRRPPQWLTEQAPGLENAGNFALLPGRPQRCRDPFVRPLDLCLLWRPGLGRRYQCRRDLLEVAVGVEEALRE